MAARNHVILFLRPLGKKSFLSSSGASLLSVILILLLLAMLASVLSCISPVASQTPLTEIHHARAYYLALSGLNSWSAGKIGTYTIGDGSFTLSESGPDASGAYNVTSRGTVRADSPSETNARITARRPGLNPITFTSDLDDFTPPTVGATANSASAITVYAANTSAATGQQDNAPPGSGANDPPGGSPSAPEGTDTAYASGSLSFGNNVTNTSGAIWYTGSRGTCCDGVCPDGMCKAGKCTLGKGLRAFFGFLFLRSDTSVDSTAEGEGFTFTIASADGNETETAAGGPASGSRGEYLGYAGPGPGGHGITAPKVAVEVDVYPNKGGNPPELSESRRDYANANHIAVVWWGNDGLDDDNVHGNGSNPQYGATANGVGYYQVARTNGANWLEDAAEHTMRLELHRMAAGGVYRLKVWIDATGVGSADVTTDYTATAPQIAYTTTLTAAQNVGLDSVIFGWTEATGSVAQVVLIHDFSLEFRH